MSRKGSKYPRVDAIEFVFWADAQPDWERIVKLNQENEYEEARWQVTIDGTECVVVGYCGDKLGSDMRLVVQGGPKPDKALDMARDIAREFRAAVRTQEVSDE